jgi:hypothetical protein
MPKQDKELTQEELERQHGEPLPDREVMSIISTKPGVIPIPTDPTGPEHQPLPQLVNANIAIPVNAAIAANVLSDGSIAYADATQDTPIDQSN